MIRFIALLSILFLHSNAYDYDDDFVDNASFYSKVKDNFSNYYIGFGSSLYDARYGEVNQENKSDTDVLPFNSVNVFQGINLSSGFSRVELGVLSKNANDVSYYIVDLQHHFYYQIPYSFLHRIKLYGGYGIANISFSPTNERSTNNITPSLTIGVEVQNTEKIFWRLGYIRYFDTQMYGGNVNNNFDVDFLNFGVVYNI